MEGSSSCTREGTLHIVGKSSGTYFARLWGKESRLQLCTSQLETQGGFFVDVVTVSDDGWVNKELPSAMQYKGETEEDSKEWAKALKTMVDFHTSRLDLITTPGVRGDVLQSLMPEVDPSLSQSGSSDTAATTVRLHVRDLLGKRTTIDANPNETVEQLKGRLAPEEPLDRVNLVFGATMLSNDATIESLKLQKDATLFLVVKRAPGGAVPVKAPAPALQAPAVAEAACGDANSDLYQRLLGLARQALEMADYGGAYRLTEKARDVLAAEDHRSVECLNVMAQVEKKRANYAEALRLYTRALELVQRSDTRLVAELHLNVGDVMRKLERYDEARREYDLAESLAKTIPSAEAKKTVCGVLIGKGLIEKKHSRFEEAKTLYVEAMKLENKQSAKYAEMAYNLADVYRKQEKLGEANTLYAEALAIIERVLGPRHAEVAEVCNALGMLLKKKGDYAAAMQNYERALSIVQTSLGPNHPKIGIYCVNLGDIHRKLGDFAAAEVNYGRALPILEQSLGADNVEVAEAMNSQGLVLKKKADYDGAEVLYRRALAIVEKTYGKKHYKYGMYMNNLADCYRKRGQYPEALNYYNESLTALKATLGETHSEVGEVYHNIALVEHQLAHYGDAAALFTKAIAIIEKEFGKTHYKMGVFLNNYGLTLAMMEDYPRAHSFLKQALTILKNKLGPDHIEVADCLAYLGDVCMKLFVQMNVKAKLQEAKELYEEANRIVLQSLGPNHPKSQAFVSLLAICKSQAEEALKVDSRPIEMVQMILYDVSGSMGTKTKLASKQTLDRREISKAFFGNFVDKIISFGYPHAVGLVTFGDKVAVDLRPTRDFEGFMTQFGNIEALQPATHLYDAIVRACEVMDAFCQENRGSLAPTCRRRILCLSDGEDSGSKNTADAALVALRKSHVVFDSVPIEGKHGPMRALSNAADGCCFLVNSYEEGLALFEREAVLSLRHREPHTRKIDPAAKVLSLENVVPYTSLPHIVAPTLLVPTLKRTPLKGAAGPAPLSAEVTKRLMGELRDLMEHPLPDFEVLSEDLSFWCLIYRGAVGTPYEGRFFVGYVDFGNGFPQCAPELRFHTPLYHCNVNADGRICLDILSQHSWKAEIAMRQVLEQLAQLIREPNAYSAINSLSGTLFRENRNAYLERARQDASQYGFAKREDTDKN